MFTSTIAAILIHALIPQGATPPAAEGVLAALNKPARSVQDKAKSWRPVFDAWLALRQPPREFGPNFNVGNIWPGMEGWEQVAAWAHSGAQLSEALVQAQNALAFGLPYGKSAVSAEYQKRGIYGDVGEGDSLGAHEFPYLTAVRGIAAFATAEMYRLAEAGKFDEAAGVAVANLRFLRRICDQQMAEEQLVAIELLIDSLRANRDMIWTYREKIPAETLKLLAKSEYPFLQATDNERLRRMQLPEGERVLLEAVLERTFGEDGQPRDGVFEEFFGRWQSRGDALGSFGAARMWGALAPVHGSLDASRKRLTNIYDDWWRRWRMNPNGPVAKLKTEFAATNSTRYAAILLMLQDLQRLFDMRDILIAEANGTAVAAGLAGHAREYGDVWPRDKDEVYATFVIKRVDFDPYQKAYPYTRGDEGRFIYRKLADRFAVETPLGRVWATNAILYARGKDHEDNDARAASFDAATGDLVIWPPIRALAREEGLVE